MSLLLHVDGERWRSHLRTYAEAHPGLAPVIKGNGYGLGPGRLARRATWLGVDTVCVGTTSDIAEVACRFDGDIVVMTPLSTDAGHDRALPGDLAARVIRTVSRPGDLELAATVQPGARVVLERMTSMRRHGLSAEQLWRARTEVAHRGLSLEGVALHLPLQAGAHLSEVRRLMLDVTAAGLVGTTIWVSHLTDDELAQLRGEYSDFTWRSRVGTGLWIGDREALSVTAEVLDVHPITRGDRFGYRSKAAPASGHLVICSGGTAHGIGLEAPSAAESLRSRAAAVARGAMEASGMVRSPFRWKGSALRFAEPPHMQASMLFVPSGGAVPAIGDQLTARVRYTATDVDRVEIS